MNGRDRLRALVVLILVVGSLPVGADDTVVWLDVLLVNATESSLAVTDRCDQAFLAWCPDCPNRFAAYLGRAPNNYILVEFQPKNQKRCITEAQAKSGLVFRARLRRKEACDSWGEGFPTWGYAAPECIERKGCNSDCWEERSVFIPLTSEGLSLAEIDGERWECWEMLEYLARR